MDEEKYLVITCGKTTVATHTYAYSSHQYLTFRVCVPQGRSWSVQVQCPFCGRSFEVTAAPAGARRLWVGQVITLHSGLQEVLASISEGDAVAGRFTRRDGSPLYLHRVHVSRRVWVRRFLRWTHGGPGPLHNEAVFACAEFPNVCAKCWPTSQFRWFIAEGRVCPTCGSRASRTH